MKKSSFIFGNIFIVLLITVFSLSTYAQPFTLPLSLQPTQEEFDRLIIENTNNDSKTWSYNATDSCLYYTFSSTKDADDWVFIPVTLSSKDNYLKVSVEALASGASNWYDEKFEIAIGSEASPTSMHTILTNTVDNDTYTTYQTTFSNDITGTAWLGIHATSPKNRRTLKIRHIILASYSMPIPQAPIIKKSEIKGLSYSATVTMPSTTVQGNPIEGSLSLHFDVDGQNVKTFDNLTSGQDVEVTATLSKGEHEITYVAYLTTNGEVTKSNAVNENVKAVDLNAKYTLPFLFGPSGQADFEECKIIDANVDDVTWQLGYPTGDQPAFFYGYHSKNQANDWVILPAVDFGDATKINISVDCRSKGTYEEAFDVWLGRDATVNDMKIKAIDVQSLKNSKQWTTCKETLSTDSGIWYIGIHVKSPADSYGLYVRNVNVEKVEKVPTAVNTIKIKHSTKIEYYNLQGMRLNSPERGQLVIVRQGNKSYKEFIK